MSRHQDWANRRADAMKAARRRVLAEHADLVDRYYREELARRSNPVVPRLAVTDRWRELVADLGPGAKLPTARELAAEMSVSEATAHAALIPLRREGLVTSAGRGRAPRYVAEGPRSAPSGVGVGLGPKVRDGLRRLVDQIEDGTFKAGDRLPAAPALGERLGTSRGTAANVLAALVAAGWATSLRGSYTYLTDPLPPRQGPILIAMADAEETGPVSAPAAHRPAGRRAGR